jgi:hypothetical protein
MEIDFSTQKVHNLSSGHTAVSGDSYCLHTVGSGTADCLHTAVSGTADCLHTVGALLVCCRRIEKRNCYLRHVCLSVRLSVCLSLSMEQRDSYWTSFLEI